jgi:hypothetical protein
MSNRPTPPAGFTKFILLLLLLMLPAATQARDENFYIFLCFGQSNMEGFPGIPKEDTVDVSPRFKVLAAVDFPALGRKQGQWYTAVPPLSRPRAGLSPADYFGRTLVEALPEKVTVGVVNVAVGGCKIELFDTSTAEAYAATAPQWMKGMIAAYDGSPYQRLVDMGRLAQKSGVIKGILLHQGESNGGDADWPKKVKVVYENLLHDLDLRAADVPLIAGEVAGADQKGAAAGMNEIIDRLPEVIPTAHVVSSKGLPIHPDHLHFTPEGYREFGKRYARTMLPLLEAK